MPSHVKTHVVARNSIEHRLLASASVGVSRTRRQLLVIAIDHGLKLYDDPTVTTALSRLKGTGLLRSIRIGHVQHYFLTPKGERELQILAQPT